MGNDDDLNIEKVFGLHRGDTHHYIERDGVDLSFVEAISREKHVAIFGCSKQGKTTLRKMHLSESEYILVTCDPAWSVEDLHASILKEAGCQVSTGRETHARNGFGSDAEVGAKIKVPFLEYSGKFGANEDQSSTTIETYDDLPIDMADPRQVIDILKQASTKKIIVIEEFHYLPERTQRQFAFKMKTFHEISNFIFIVVGVWLEENRLVVLNSDLGGRVASINADMWPRGDLERVIVKGGSLLNVSFPQAFVDQLLNEAAGSVYIVREACYRALEQIDVYNRQGAELAYEGDIPLKSIVRNIANSLSDYQSFVYNLGRKHKDVGDFSRIVLYLLASSTPQDMISGISVRKIKTRMSRSHTHLDNVRDNHIRAFLNRLEGLQKECGIPVIFDYDRSNDRVRITDKGFILWRKAQKKDDIEEMIFDANPVY
ncbi:MAG: hypothetical protein AAF543_07970 [Pseudomonadota bacterium]